MKAWTRHCRFDLAQKRSPAAKGHVPLAAQHQRECEQQGGGEHDGGAQPHGGMSFARHFFCFVLLMMT